MKSWVIALALLTGCTGEAAPDATLGGAADTDQIDYIVLLKAHLLPPPGTDDDHVGSVELNAQFHGMQGEQEAPREVGAFVDAHTGWEGLLWLRYRGTLADPPRSVSVSGRRQLFVAQQGQFVADAVAPVLGSREIWYSAHSATIPAHCDCRFTVLSYVEAQDKFVSERRPASQDLKLLEEVRKSADHVWSHTSGGQLWSISTALGGAYLTGAKTQHEPFRLWLPRAPNTSKRFTLDRKTVHAEIDLLDDNQRAQAWLTNFSQIYSRPATATAGAPYLLDAKKSHPAIHYDQENDSVLVLEATAMRHYPLVLFRRAKQRFPGFYRFVDRWVYTAVAVESKTLAIFHDLNKIGFEPAERQR
jgi:hypothetical protein